MTLDAARRYDGGRASVDRRIPGRELARRADVLRRDGRLGEAAQAFAVAAEALAVEGRHVAAARCVHDLAVALAALERPGEAVVHLHAAREAFLSAAVTDAGAI